MSVPLFEPTLVRESITQATAGWTAAGADNTAATLTIPGVPGICHAIAGGVAWSYSGSGTLAGGLLTIKDGATVVFSMAVTAAGAGFIPWRGHGSPGNDLVVTLAAGADDVDAKVNICGYAMLVGAGTGSGSSMDFSDYSNSWLLAVI